MKQLEARDIEMGRTASDKFFDTASIDPPVCWERAPKRVKVGWVLAARSAVASWLTHWVKPTIDNDEVIAECLEVFNSIQEDGEHDFVAFRAAAMHLLVQSHYKPERK